MNSIVLMAEILTEPELRFTPDNLAVASFLISFPSTRPDDPDNQVRVAMFGDAAQQAVDERKVGDRVILEGQLNVDSIERDGRKEKRAEVSVRRIHLVTGEVASTAPAASARPASRKQTPRPTAATPTPASTGAPDLDDIPFAPPADMKTIWL
ncbi:MAG: single-stranded DNA-binding protein [Cyanobacteria bacterium J06642_2]